MSEEEDRSEFKAYTAHSEMTEQDYVRILTGTWVRESSGTWVFDSENEDEIKYVRLKSGLEYEIMVDLVKERLGIESRNVTIKLSYQYPSWMLIDDGDGSTPQFISDDHEVEVFVQMRRKIEEVNLFVTIAQCVDGVTTAPPKPPVANVNGQMVGTLEDGENEPNDVETEEEWMEFTMSETPLTRPPMRNAVGGSFRAVVRETIPSRSNGIVIRENNPIIRLRSPHPCEGNHGKGKAILREHDSGSQNGRRYSGNGVTPEGSIGEDGEPSRGVKRRLFPTEGIEEEVDMIAEASDATSVQAPIHVAEPAVGVGEQSAGLNHWSRFQDALHEILDDETSQNVLFGRDAPPVVEGSEKDGIEDALEAVPYEGDNLFVGQVFKSKNDCKIKIAIHAINRKFHFKTKRSTPTFMVLICVATDCPWRVYAARVDETGNFQIRQATLTHCCTLDARRNYHKLATTQVIGELIQSRFIAIKRGPSPATIRKMLLDDFHVNVSYWKSWRGREIAMELALGSMAGSYALMPGYMGLLQTTNPGSICELHTEETTDGHMVFKFAFIALDASIKGYRYMRKVIIIDGTSLKGRYGGCLLSASAQDGNFQIFPLAYAIVDSENDEAWSWFLTQLKTFASDEDHLVFVSDRHGSIYNAIEKVYPKASHASCTVHLWRNIKARFKSKRLASLMGAAARAYTVAEFNKKFLDIQRVSPRCAGYLVEIGFEHWTRAHFAGERFNIMDSNIAESWNAVLTEAREFPLISMCEYIRTKMMCWFAIRRGKALEHKGTLTPNVRRMVEANYDASTGFAVTGISEMEFQIQSPTGEFHLVNLHAGTCTCTSYQQLRIPCSHAVAAAGRAGMATEAMVAAAYFAETWHSAYEAKIYPIPSVGRTEMGETYSESLLPPAVKRPPGRPKKQRILSVGEDKRSSYQQPRKCSRCRGEGHNKASCRRPI